MTSAKGRVVHRSDVRILARRAVGLGGVLADERVDEGVVKPIVDSVKNHDGCLAAEFEVDALEVGGSGKRDLLPGDRDQTGHRMIDERPAGVTVPDDDVHHAGREMLADDPTEQRGRDRRRVGRLEYHGVAGSNAGPNFHTAIISR